jgi:hypothetical protein
LKIKEWRPRLQMVKNAAYAWRQMLFFLSVAPAGMRESFLARADSHLGEQSTEFQTRFRPALMGVARALHGLTCEALPSPDEPAGARCFLGWTTERHWLLG